jgi:hypothetical protein
VTFANCTGHETPKAADAHDSRTVPLNPTDPRLSPRLTAFVANTGIGVCAPSDRLIDGTTMFTFTFAVFAAALPACAVTVNP